MKPLLFLPNHGEKVACGWIVVFCVWWSLESLNWKAMQVNVPDLKPSPEALAAYRFQPERLIPYSATLRARLADKGGPQEMAAHLFFPQPERSVVEGVAAPPPPPPPGRYPSLAGLQVKGGHGQVAIAVRQPEETQDFTPIRVEIERCTSEAAWGKRIHDFVFTPPGEVAQEPVKEAVPIKPDPRRRGAAIRKTHSKPAEPADEMRYVDAGLQAGVVYRYRARVICRLTDVGGPQDLLLKDRDVRLPDGVGVLREGPEGETLYAGPWMPEVSTGTLEDLQIRYHFLRPVEAASGAGGKPDCHAFLGIRLWDDEAQAWGEGSLELSLGKPVKGELKFTQGANVRVRTFDSGLVLETIRPAVMVRTETRKELVTESREDENGGMAQFAVNDGLGKYRWVKRACTIEVPTEVAILRREDGDKRLLLVKGLGYGEAPSPQVKLKMEGEP